MSTCPSRRYGAFLRCLTGLVLLLSALPGHALTTCVGTVQQLHDALASATLSSDANVIIRVRAATYNSTPALDFRTTLNHANQVIEISGGWSGPNNSCQDKIFDGSTTILVGSAGKPALAFDGNSATSGSTIYLHDLTLSNQVFTSPDFGACLNGSITAGNEALLDRVQMVECLAPNGVAASAYLQNSAGELTLRNVIARTGKGKNNGGMAISTKNGGNTRIAQVTVTNTESATPSSSTSGLSVENYTNSFTYITNSVFWGNDDAGLTADLSVYGAGVFLTRTHYGKLAGTPATNLTPSTGDPGFVSIKNPHLRHDSILIDSGVANPLGNSGTFDAEGHTRVFGAAVDIGAIEADVIFAGDFEPRL